MEARRTLKGSLPRFTAGMATTQVVVGFPDGKHQRVGYANQLRRHFNSDVAVDRNGGRQHQQHRRRADQRQPVGYAARDHVV